MGVAYKWHVQMIFLENGNNPININAVNIDSGVIDYNYQSEARMPIMMINVNLDKNLIDKMVKTKDKSRIQLIVNKVNITNGSNIHEPYINHICTYELNDDVYDEKTINYGKDTGALQRKDVYAHTVIGLISEQIVESNVKANDCVLKDGNMAGAVAYFLRHMPLVIEPFSFNKEYEQLIVPPQESTNEILKFLNNIGTFYDTPYRYFMDFNYTYLLSTNGTGVPVQGEKFNDVIISIKNADTDPDALELGISEENGAYVIKVLEDYSNIFVNNTQDKDFTKIVGILDPSRKDSLPAIINDVISVCKQSANEILSSVRAAVPMMMNSINDVIAGKNEVDFSCHNTIKDASAFKENCSNAASVLTEFKKYLSRYMGSIVENARNKYYSGDNAATKPPFDPTPYMNQSNSYQKEIEEIINTLTNQAGPAIDNFLNIMTSGQGSFSTMSGRSGTVGCNITDYTGSIEGIKINNLSNNIDLMCSKKNINNADIQNVKDLATKSDNEFRSSQSAMSDTTSYALNIIGRGIAIITEIKDSLKNSESDSSGTGSSSSSSSASVLELERMIKTLSDINGEINMERGNMSASFDNMIVQSNRGRSLANLMQTTQNNIDIEVDNLMSNKDLLAEQFDMSSILSGGIGGIVDSVNGMIGNFTNLFGVVESQVKQATNSAKASIEKAEALTKLGIGSINDLSDISKIGDLSEVAKLGVSCIESGSLDILKSGGSEKIKYVNLDNDDPNKIKALQNSVEQSGTVLSIHKEGMDTSVLTLNKRYMVRNTDSRREQDGHYLLIHKQEAFTRHGDLYDIECFLTFFRLKK